MKKVRSGLLKHHTRKDAREFIDFDYLGKLSEAELDWLNKFSQEYYQRRFDEDSTATKEDKREAAQRENERNRDIWNTGHRDPLEADIDEQIRTRKFRRKKQSDE